MEVMPKHTVLILTLTALAVVGVILAVCCGGCVMLSLSHETARLAQREKAGAINLRKWPIASEADKAATAKIVSESMRVGVLHEIRNGRAFVGPRFSELPISDKRNIVEAWCRFALQLPVDWQPANRSDGWDAKMHLYDSRTGKHVGRFDFSSGLSLD